MSCKLTVGVRLKGRCMRGDSRYIKTLCAARARFDAAGVYINLSRAVALHKFSAEHDSNANYPMSVNSAKSIMQREFPARNLPTPRAVKSQI